MEMNEIAKVIHENAWDKGFHKESENIDVFIERACNNLHDEISELHEAWRNNKLFHLCDKADKMKKMEIKPLTNAEEELADILIRTLDNCLKLGINPEDVVLRKHTYNKSRDYRHGGKLS